MSIFDEAKIDTHCHVLDPQRFPYPEDIAYRPAGQEIAPVAQYRQVMDAYGIRHALLVGPNSGYQFDNRCLLDAIEHGEGRFKGIAVTPLDVSDATLAELQARGVIGLAFNATLFGTAHYAGSAGLLQRLARRDMLLSLQVQGDQLPDLRAMVEASGVRVLVDHCGRPQAQRGVDQPGFQALLAMAANGRTAVKLSGFQKFSAQAAPFADTQPFVQALLQAYTPAACLWASDWPFLRATQHLDVGPILRQVQALLPDAAARRQLLWDTPRRWLGFDGSN